MIPGLFSSRGKVVPKAGAVELHLFGSDTPGTLFGRSENDVKKDFEKVSDQVKQILENAFTKVPEGLRIEKRRDLSWA